MRQRSSGVSAEFSLAGLLERLSVETFLDEIWAVDHYHVKRGCPGFFDALLPGSSTVDELLELFRHEPSAVRLVRGKTKRAPTGVALHFAQLVIKVAPDHKDTLQFLSKNTEPFRICDLPGLSAAQQTELARTLIVTGFLIRLPDD